MFLLMAITLTGITLLSCNDDEKEESIRKVNKIALSDDTSSLLDSLFKQQNQNLYVDTILIINSMTELNALIDYNGAEIDFSNYTLIVGYISTPNLSCNITSNDLYYDSVNKSYIFKINVDIGIFVLPALDTLCFWGMYPKINNDAKMNLKVNYNNVKN